MGGRQGAAGGEKKGRGRPFWGAFRAAFCGRPAQGAKGRKGCLLLASLCGIIKSNHILRAKATCAFALYICHKRLKGRAPLRGPLPGAAAQKDDKLEGRYRSWHFGKSGCRLFWQWLSALRWPAYSPFPPPRGRNRRKQAGDVKRGDFKGRGLDDFEGAGA